MDYSSQDQDERDRELERQIREQRKFSLAEAIGRMGGGELMKGASPITRKRQAELVIENYLEKHLRDAEGALERVLLKRAVASGVMLADSYVHPLAMLANYCQQLLDSEGQLQGFVRAVDAEWGRMYLERPRFEQPGRPATDDDPYTHASVAKKLQQLIAELADTASDE